MGFNLTAVLFGRLAGPPNTLISIRFQFFCAAWEASGRSWKALFTDEGVRASFLICDVHELRAAYWAGRGEAAFEGDFAEEELG